MSLTTVWGFAMLKRRVDYRCRHCNHIETISLYDEGYGLDRAAFWQHGCDRSNRERHERMGYRECSACGRSGFVRAN